MEIEPVPHIIECVPQNIVDLDRIAVAPLYARFSGLERDCKRGRGAFHGQRSADPLTVAAEFQISDPLSIKALAADMCGVDSVPSAGLSVVPTNRGLSRGHVGNALDFLAPLSISPGHAVQ